MRGKVFFIAILIIIVLMSWQYLPMVTVHNQPIIPGFLESKHEKLEDAEPMETIPGYDSDGDGLLDYEEDANGNGLQDFNLGETNRFDPDSDDDGLNDGAELKWWNNRYLQQLESDKIPKWVRELHPNLGETELFDLFKPTGDLDGDGTANILDFDSDNDGLSDGMEVNKGTDPANPDSDKDGVIDSEDNNPLENIDEDGDSIPDDWEDIHDIDDPYDDPDNDGRTNQQEYFDGTDPNLPDEEGGDFEYSDVNLDQFYEKDFNEPVFRVEPIDNPKYWRLTAFDQYNDGSWLKYDEKMTEYQTTILPEVTRYQSSKNETYTIEFYGPYQGYMPTSLHTTNIFNTQVDNTKHEYEPNFEPTVYVDTETGYYIHEKMRAYEFAMIDYTYSDSMLMSAKVDKSEPFNRYLTVPDEIEFNDELNELAKNITKDTVTDFNAVIKIVNYLKDNYKYNINYPQPTTIAEGANEDPLIRFLFRYGEGICVHFASAFVILCRLNNIPARFVSGYALGDIEFVAPSNPDESTEEYRIIREGHKHAWSEVIFEGLGWLPFEVTGYNSGEQGGTGVDSNGTDRSVYSGDDFGGDGGGTLQGKNETIDPDDYPDDGDADKDGLTNGEEKELGTNLLNPDTDGDGLSDFDEVKVHKTNPLKKDTDSDGLTDYIEVNSEYPFSLVDWDKDGLIDYKTDPNNADTDEGGTWDGIEVEAASNPLNGSDDDPRDSDEDGLRDSEEKLYGTNITDRDTDDDELIDGLEVYVYKTNPLDNDTDDDGLLDGIEVFEHKTNPKSIDTDSDNLDDYYELYVSNTNPNNPDSDGDGLPDGIELDDSDGNVTDPLNDDTDGDGLYDGEEDSNKNGRVDSTKASDWNEGDGPGETDPVVRDTDGGGLWDGTEVWGKFNPLDPTDDNTTEDHDWDGLSDTQEVLIGTDPLDPDSDNDGLIDGKEVNTHHTNPLNEDSDDDNITDGEEIYIGEDGYRTNPLDSDTDNDTLDDWSEIYIYETDPTITDTDDDKLSDGLEVKFIYSNSTVDWNNDGELDYTTDPNNPDTDGGGIDDGSEVWNSYDPLNKYDDKLLHDDDGDGLININEESYGTDPQNPDTDGDGIQDGEEVNEGADGYITDPLDFDTDKDTLPDGLEVDGNLGYTTNPLKNDTDGDGLLDNEEIIYGTNPTKADTDSDGLIDSVELDDSDGFTTDPNDWDSDGDWLPDGWIDRNNNGIRDPSEFEDRNKNGRIDSLDPSDWNNGSGPGETDPNKRDTDGGGANDFFEINRTYNPLDATDDSDLKDADGDGITDSEENETYGTDWLDPDTDNDELNDYEEIFKHKTNATNPDTDSDGLNDKEEVEIGSDGYKTNPNLNDTDNDTLLDWDEVYIYGTNPTKFDTDGDGKPDWAEVNTTSSRSTRSSNFQIKSRSYNTIRSNGNTNATDWDTDGDGLPDGWIDGWGYNLTQKKWGLWENLKNGKQERGVRINDVILAEFEDKANFNVVDPDETDSLKADTDGGGAWDGDEVIANPPRDPVDNASDDWDIIDFDRDGIPNVMENQTGTLDKLNQTKWNVSDTDNDGLWDGENIDINYDGKNDYKGEQVGHNGFGSTYPNSSDSDNDGLLDGEEVKGDYGYKTNPNRNDTDRDGLLDGFNYNGELGELTKHYSKQEKSTNPLKADSDSDGIWDGFNITVNSIFYYGELDHGTNPVDSDTDNDYLSDGEEIMNWKTNPLKDDSDGGSASDGTELIFRFPPTDPLDPADDIILDTDDDGIMNHIENKTKFPYSTVNWDGLAGVDYYTNWKNNDTDKDGLLDGEEVLIFFTNPLHNDTDNDTISDYDELNGVNGYVTDPLKADTDNDGLTDILEITTYHTDPTLNDTDNGGINDYIEVKIQFTNPNDPSDDGGDKVPIVETKILIHSVSINVTKGELFTVKGNITTIDNASVWPADIMVKIYMTSNISNTNYALAGSGIVKELDGEFFIECIVPTIISYGENRVIAYASSKLTKMKQYNESWSYNNPDQTRKNSTIYVHSDTILKFINISNAVNKDAIVRGEGILTDIAGIPIHNGRVLIYFDEVWKETNRTDSKGKLKYSFIANVSESEIGEHEIVLFFEGSKYLNQSRTNFTIQVRSDNTNIDFQISPSEDVKVNENIWITGNITGLNDIPLTTKMTIYFELTYSDAKIEKYFFAENGSFKVQMYLSPSEFAAGLYDVYLEFPGSDIYSEDTSYILEIYIRGQSSFSYPEDFTMYRDSGGIEIPVKLVDNLGNPLGGKDVTVHYELPTRTYDGTLTTSINGTFIIPFQSEYDDPLGIVNIKLNYQAPNGSKYASNTTIMEIFIKSPTVLDLEVFPQDMIRTDGYFFKGIVKDDQGMPATGETIMVSLGSEESIITHFSSVTDSKGEFEISVLVPLSFPLGNNNVEISTGLSDKYEPYNYTYHVTLRARPIITIHVNSTIKSGKDYLITISLTEDNGKRPISKATLLVYLDEVLDAHLITDKLGYAYYENTYPNNIEELEILVNYTGSRKENYIETESATTLSPEKTEEKKTDYIGALWFYWPLIIGCIIIVVIISLWYRWRKQHITEIHEVLSDLMTKLETKDKTRRAIFDAYLKLLAILEHYGFIRKDSETAREFEDAIREALPQVNAKNLDSLTTLFEVARYSTHRMRKADRKKAMKNLKFIRHSLEPSSKTISATA